MNGMSISKLEEANQVSWAFDEGNIRLERCKLFYGFESGFRQVETEARGVWMEKKGGEEIPSKEKKGQ